MPKSKVHAKSRQRAELDADAAAVIAEVMHALSTPSRVRLLYALRARELSVGELAYAAALTPAAASQQLRVLRHLRLVVSRRDGQSTRYRLHDDHVAALLEEIANHFEHTTRGWESPSPATSRDDRERRPLARRG